MKILIVEDDPTSSKYLQEAVKALRFEFRVAENGREGLKVFEEYHPDVVLSDIQMPEMDGLELLEELRAKKSEAIVVMLTAYGSEEYAIQSFRKGANNYLKKPINHKEMVIMLKNYDKVIRSRTEQSEFPGEILQRESIMKLNSDIEKVPAIIDHLIKETGKYFDHSERTEIEVGLNELIMNAIEHGNMGITSAEKAIALKKNNLPELYQSRMSDEKYANRTVRVNFTLNSTFCEWIINDEGEGFDWESIPNPTLGNNLFELNGRGIFISRFQFDELEYLEKGNIVRVRKYKKN